MIRFTTAAFACVALTSCATPKTRHVTVAYVADLHAQLEAHPELFWRDGTERVETAGGFAHVASAGDEQAALAVSELEPQVLLQTLAGLQPAG